MTESRSQVLMFSHCYNEKSRPVDLEERTFQAHFRPQPPPWPRCRCCWWPPGRSWRRAGRRRPARREERPGGRTPTRAWPWAGRGARSGCRSRRRHRAPPRGAAPPGRAPLRPLRCPRRYLGDPTAPPSLLAPLQVACSPLAPLCPCRIATCNEKITNSVHPTCRFQRKGILNLIL